MMTTTTKGLAKRLGSRIAVLALATTASLALAACEEHNYPAAAPHEATSAPPPQGDALMGAPTGPDGGPGTTRTPEYVPPENGPSGPPSGAYPPPGYGPPAPYGPPGYPPQAYPPSGYPPGYAHQNPQGAPPEIVTMAPIPNPPEEPHRAYGWRHRHHYRLSGYTPAYGAPMHRRHHRFHAVQPVHGPAGTAPMRHAPAHVVARPMAPVHHLAPAAHPGAQLTKPGVPAGPHHGRHADAAAVAAASGSPQASESTANTTSNTVASGSEADRYQALQGALHSAFSDGAILTVPSSMTTNQASLVTLTLPAAFADTVKTESARQGLSDATATMNLGATLTGDGYLIAPSEPQSLPLAANGPTTFEWRVTPTGDARPALKASVRAEAVGGGHDLTLGDKTTGGGVIGRWVGIGLLAVIALIVIGWFARRGSKPARTKQRPQNPYDNANTFKP